MASKSNLRRLFSGPAHLAICRFPCGQQVIDRIHALLAFLVTNVLLYHCIVFPESDQAFDPILFFVPQLSKEVLGSVFCLLQAKLSKRSWGIQDPQTKII